jgi:hypothetical protein
VLPKIINGDVLLEAVTEKTAFFSLSISAANETARIRIRKNATKALASLN